MSRQQFESRYNRASSARHDALKDGLDPAAPVRGNVGARLSLHRGIGHNGRATDPAILRLHEKKNP